MEHTDLTRDLLEQVKKDDLAAEEFADYIEENFLIRAPGDLKSSVMKRCIQPDVKLPAEARKLSHRTRLLLYSLKVGTDIRFSVPFYQKARQITDNLNRMSYELSNWEVYLYDEKKE